jgi:nucleoid-associated protein YgaU
MYDGATDLMRLRYPRPRPRPRRRSAFRQAAVGVAAFGLLAFGFAHAVHGSSGPAYESVTVQPGDTLWSIAAERYPNADTREKVDEIERANGLSDPFIRAGQDLRVPAS